MDGGHNSSELPADNTVANLVPPPEHSYLPVGPLHQLVRYQDAAGFYAPRGLRVLRITPNRYLDAAVHPTSLYTDLLVATILTSSLRHDRTTALSWQTAFNEPLCDTDTNTNSVTDITNAFPTRTNYHRAPHS